jgi:hypothetical protein
MEYTYAELERIENILSMKNRVLVVTTPLSPSGDRDWLHFFAKPRVDGFIVNKCC